MPLYFGGIFICLKMFDDVREPYRKAIIPAGALQFSHELADIFV